MDASAAVASSLGRHLNGSDLAHICNGMSRDTLFDFFNISQRNYSDYVELWVTRPEWEIRLRCLLFLPFVLASLCGNAGILLSVTRVASMRTAINYFLCNMAIVDMINSFIITLDALYVEILQKYPLGQVGCKSLAFMKVLCIQVSVYSLLVISGERLRAVMAPLRVSPFAAYRWTTLVTMSLIWLVALGFASPFVFGKSFRIRSWLDYDETWCLEENFLKYYWPFVLLLTVYLPLIVMTAVYTCILVKLDRFLKIVVEARSNLASTVTSIYSQHAQGNDDRFEENNPAPRINMNMDEAVEAADATEKAHPSLGPNGSETDGEAAFSGSIRLNKDPFQLIQETSLIVSGLRNENGEASRVANASGTGPSHVSWNDGAKKGTRKMGNSLAVASSAHHVTGGGVDPSSVENKSQRYKRKVLMMLFGYLIASILIWFPLQFCVFHRLIKYVLQDQMTIPEGVQLAYSISDDLGVLINCTVNPIIYGILNKSFRHAIFRRLLPAHCFLVSMWRKSQRRSRSRKQTLRRKQEREQAKRDKVLIMQTIHRDLNGVDNPAHEKHDQKNDSAKNEDIELAPRERANTNNGMSSDARSRLGFLAARKKGHMTTSPSVSIHAGLVVSTSPSASQFLQLKTPTTSGFHGKSYERWVGRGDGRVRNASDTTPTHSLSSAALSQWAETHGDTLARLGARYTTGKKHLNQENI